MALLINKSEVRKHLTKLGYLNLPEELLEQFILDLESFIEREEGKKVKFVDRRDDSSNSSNTSELTAAKGMCSVTKTQSCQHRHFSREHVAANDQESRLMKRKTCKRDERGKVTVVESYTESVYSTETLVSDSELPDQENTSIPSPVFLDDSLSSSSGPLRPPPTIPSLTVPLAPSCQQASHPVSSAGPSTVRPRSQKSLKNDPVARYHQYKSFWANLKLPGEDKRSEVRWNVRGMMMGHLPENKIGIPSRLKTAAATSLR